MDIIRKLKIALADSGLHDEEIGFYVNVLKHPKSTVFDVAKRSGIPKDRAYKICDLLSEKGLLISDLKRKHRKLEFAPLKNFIDDLCRKGRKYYRTADSLKQVTPFLSFLNVPHTKGSIENFSIEQFVDHYMDLSYVNWETILAYGNFEMIYDAVGADADKEFVKKRMARGKKAYPLLSSPGPYTWELVNNDKKEMRKSKIIHSDKLSDSMVFLMPDKNLVSFWVKDENGFLKGACIENPLVSKLHEQIYHYFDGVAEAQNAV